jgi:hypothetical protein
VLERTNSIGRHLPTSAGLGKMLQRAGDLGCETVQVFISNPQGWAEPVSSRTRASSPGARGSGHLPDRRPREVPDQPGIPQGGAAGALGAGAGRRAVGRRRDGDRLRGRPLRQPRGRRGGEGPGPARGGLERARELAEGSGRRRSRSSRTPSARGASSAGHSTPWGR